jgi:hypothetical protein
LGSNNGGLSSSGSQSESSTPVTAIIEPEKLASAIGQAITGNAADVGVGALVMAVVLIIGVFFLIQFLFVPH